MADGLADRGHEALGHSTISTLSLDILAIAPMFGLCALLTVTRDLHVWVRVCLTLGLLYLLKGILDYATDLPDSGGWNDCVARLNAQSSEVTQYFIHLNNLNGTDFTQQFLQMEFLGVPTKTGNRVQARFCADMILSGHTFTFIVILLGILELLQKYVGLFAPQCESCIISIANLVAGLAITIEAGLIVLSRFHYTVDVLIAVPMAFLLYTNHSLSILASWFICWLEPEVPEEAPLVWTPMLMCPCFNGFHRATSASVLEMLTKSENESAPSGTSLAASSTNESKRAETEGLMFNLWNV